MGSDSASTFTVSMLGSVVGTLRLCSKRSLRWLVADMVRAVADLVERLVRFGGRARWYTGGLQAAQ